MFWTFSAIFSLTGERLPLKTDVLHDSPKIVGSLGAGTTTMLNRADECRQRADECRRNAAQEADDVLRATYLDFAPRWRMMAQRAENAGTLRTWIKRRSVSPKQARL
jgi:hypothetical protein